MSASSRHVRTSFVDAFTWSASVWRRVVVSLTSRSRPVVKTPWCLRRSRWTCSIRVSSSIGGTAAATSEADSVRPMMPRQWTLARVRLGLFFPKTGEPPMTLTENKTLVSRFIDEIFVQGRRESVDELLADDFVAHTWPSTGDPNADLKAAIDRTSKGLANVRF